MSDLPTSDSNGERQQNLVMNKWQKREATLLYHFASLDYLLGLKELVDAFMSGVDVSAASGGDHDGEHWQPNERPSRSDSNLGFRGIPAMVGFQECIARNIVSRSTMSYWPTGWYSAGRLHQETSAYGFEGEDAKRFDAGWEMISHYSSHIDMTMDRGWREDIFQYVWQKKAALFMQLPKFRIRTDVEAESGKPPPITGVYVPQNDPSGSLQFAWTGNNFGHLDDCSTFNALGLSALAIAGKDGLWQSDPRLLRLVQHPSFADAFKADRGNWPESESEYLSDPRRARSFVYRHGLHQRPRKWFLLEQIEGEFESAEIDSEPIDSHHSAEVDDLVVARLVSEFRAAVETTDAMPLGTLHGTNYLCSQTGWWQSIDTEDERMGLRFVREGDRMPPIAVPFTRTLWQRLRGEAATREQATKWKLVRYDSTRRDP